MRQQAFCITNMLGRFVTDFGNVVRFLDSQDFAVAILTGMPKRHVEQAFDSINQFNKYKDNLPPSVSVELLPYRRGELTPLSVLRLFIIGLRLTRSRRDSLFLLWTYVMIIACGIPLRLFNRKCLFMVTGLGPILDPRNRQFALYRSIVMPIYGYLLRGRNSRCLVHNFEDKQYLASKLSVDPDEIFVTPGCGVDPREFPFFEHAPQRTVKVILVPARLLVEKGIFEAAEASRLLRQRGLPHEMRFTSSVEPHQSIGVSEEDITRLQRQNPSIRFLGFQESLVPLYEECDIVCLPTRYPEGLPTALIQAAACGRAAVTCDNVGCREIVRHNETGLLVPMGDAKALADALERLIQDADLRDRLRRKAYEAYLRSYTKDEALKRTIAAFDSLGYRFSNNVRG